MGLSVSQYFKENSVFATDGPVHTSAQWVCMKPLLFSNLYLIGVMNCTACDSSLFYTGGSYPFFIQIIHLDGCSMDRQDQKRKIHAHKGKFYPAYSVHVHCVLQPLKRLGPRMQNTPMAQAHCAQENILRYPHTSNWATDYVISYLILSLF